MPSRMENELSYSAMRVCLDCRNSWTGEVWTCPRCGFGPEEIGGYPAFAPELAAENTNYPTGYFDVIAACDVIEHIVRDDLALAEIHRAVKPGGGIVVTVPQDPKLWSTWDELSFHQRRYTRQQLLDTVRAAGFTVERLVSMSSLIY